MADEGLGASIQLGEYILGELLAAGGMAEIYHATCSNAGRFRKPIVLKRMHEHLARDREFVTMFVDEARISTRLDHPNIVQLYDFQATSDGLYIILEYVDGPDLLSLLKGGARRRTAMPAEIAVYILCHVLEALDYAHSVELSGRNMGVVHRDVSPGNVLISRQGHVKLADFGIARANDRQRETATGTLKGKYGYMSPEQVEAKHLDGRSDVFAAAIVLSELLMSKRLFAAPNQLDVLLMVRSADLSRLHQNASHIDPELLAIIVKALQRDRVDRYASAGDFRDALADWLSRGTTRMSAQVLKGYIEELESGGFIKRATRGEGPNSITISGTNTQAASQGAQQAAQLGRQIFDLGTMVTDQMDMTLGAAGVTVISSRPEALRNIDDQPLSKPVHTQEALRLGRGELGTLMPMDLIGGIASSKRSGLLTLDRDTVMKEVYFVDGHPIFVASNDPQERFGQFLLLRGLLTERQLDKAIATMPHFGGRLGQALVGLKLLRPVDAVQLLTEQVREKLLRCCCWEEGRFVWQEGATNPHEIVPLHLSSFRIVARGVQLLPEEQLSNWSQAHLESRPNLAAMAPYEEYGFGPSLSKRLESLDGTRSVGEVVSSVSGKGTRVLSAAVYALMACAKV